MKKRFFAHYEKVTGKNGGTVSFRVPDGLRFELAEIIIRENETLSYNGGAVVEVSTVSNEYKTAVKIPRDFLTRKNGSESTAIGFVSTQQFDTVLMPLVVSGGDSIQIEVSTRYRADAVVDVLILGQKVGEF